MNARYTSDRRTAPRVAQSGHVQLTFEDPVPAAIEAELVEMSATGFRASYGGKGLAPGLEVQYRRDQLSGHARVVWTHILEGKRVSGFLILGG